MSNLIGKLTGQDKVEEAAKERERVAQATRAESERRAAAAGDAARKAKRGGTLLSGSAAGVRSKTGG